MRRVGTLLAVAILAVCGSPVEPYDSDLALTGATETDPRRGPAEEAGDAECERRNALPGGGGEACAGFAPPGDEQAADPPPEAPGAADPPTDDTGAADPPGSPQAPDLPDEGDEAPAPDAHPPTGGAFLAHEPMGMTEVFGNNPMFPGDRSGPNQAGTASGGYDSWGWRSQGANFVSLDPTSEGIPNSPAATDADNVWVGVFPRGHAPGTGPFSVAYSRPSQTARRSMYWSMYLYFSDPFDFNTCTTKGFWMSQTGQNNHFLPIYRSATSFGVYLQFNDGPPDTRSNREYDGMPSSELRDRLGTWFHLEVLMVANTDGREDGKYRLWVDGALEAAHDTIYYFDDDDFDRGRDSFETIRLNPTWGCLTGGDVPQRQFMALDDWYASSSSSRVN